MISNSSYLEEEGYGKTSPNEYRRVTEEVGPMFDDSGYYTGEGHPAEAVSKEMTRPNVSHYTKGGIQPVDFINSQELNFNLGNVVKYVTRADYKGTKRKDLMKAIDYINFELEMMEDE